MNRTFYKGVLLGSVIAILVSLTGTAMAGTGIGAIFNLGKANSANTTTSLSGTTSGKVLQVTNKGAGPALGLTVKAGKPPLATNSSVKVTNLNADRLDGINSTGFVRGGGSIVQARLTEPLSSSNSTILSVPGFGTIEASTGNGGVPNYRLFWRNSLSGTTMDVWYTIGGVTYYASLVPGSGVYVAPIDTDVDEIYQLRAGYAGHTMTLSTAAHADGGGGVYYAQAIAQ
jgi:hypothetical protein